MSERRDGDGKPQAETGTTAAGGTGGAERRRQATGGMKANNKKKRKKRQEHSLFANSSVVLYQLCPCQTCRPSPAARQPARSNVNTEPTQRNNRYSAHTLLVRPITDPPAVTCAPFLPSLPPSWAGPGINCGFDASNLDFGTSLLSISDSLMLIVCLGLLLGQYTSNRFP